MRAPISIALTLAAACGSPAPLTLVGSDRSDAPIAGLEAHWLTRFGEGDIAFDAPFRESQGLGPLYIRIACASCHEDDARGPGVVRKMALSDESAALPFGSTLRPLRAAGAMHPIEAPAGARLSSRLGPPVFGRGYLEAIAASEIESAEREQASDGVVSGRIHRVAYQSVLASPDRRFHSHTPGDRDLIGRFGHKARIATVDEFVADAYQGDMGITTPLRPEELPNPDGLRDDRRPGVDLDLATVTAAADYVRLLAIPARVEPPAGGAELFERSGCARCHTPSMHTRSDYPIPQIADIDAALYTDVLLHDMGEGLADGVRDGDASGREWRTAPLIGVRHVSGYMHDGRASTVEEAIAAHDSPGSEASFAVRSYRALSESERRTLIAFVSGL